MTGYDTKSGVYNRSNLDKLNALKFDLNNEQNYKQFVNGLLLIIRVFNKQTKVPLFKQLIQNMYQKKIYKILILVLKYDKHLK